VPPDPGPILDFKHAASVVLDFLSARLPFGLWMVTRTEGEDWIALTTASRDYDVVDGTLMRWSDSFCSRMVVGLGPRVAPQSATIPAYAAAPIGQQVRIAAYIGVPILREDGSLFGTLCAIDKNEQSDSITAEQPLVELLANLLGCVLTAELRTDVERRRAERALEESLVDELTGLGNRRAWERILDAEEDRCARYGDPASVLVIDLDGLKQKNDTEGHAAGDAMLQAAATAIRSAMRDSDFAARVGGDEFAILAVNANAADVEMVRVRIASALSERGVRASIGTATRHPLEGLQAATVTADSRMYEAKRARHTGTDPEGP
jgi:diguanylate cyclase (GGDEF)-like protein